MLLKQVHPKMKHLSLTTSYCSFFLLWNVKEDILYASRSFNAVTMNKEIKLSNFKKNSKVP